MMCVAQLAFYGLLPARKVDQTLLLLLHSLIGEDDGVPQRIGCADERVYNRPMRNLAVRNYCS
jgi:hypothetical protein